MEVIEQLQFEAAERAGSPEGFMRLIKLLLSEVEKLNFNTGGEAAQRQYVSLLRAYVLVKRKIRFFEQKCERVEMDRQDYSDTLRRLKEVIATKRSEARKYAAEELSPEQVKVLKTYTGRNLGLRPSEFMSISPEYLNGNKLMEKDSRTSAE